MKMVKHNQTLKRLERWQISIVCQLIGSWGQKEVKNE